MALYYPLGLQHINRLARLSHPISGMICYNLWQWNNGLFLGKDKRQGTQMMPQSLFNS